MQEQAAERRITLRYAVIVTLHLIASIQSRGFTAPANAMLKQGERRRLQMYDLRIKVFRYRFAMSLARRLFNEGYLTKEEYALIDTNMIQKYELSENTIFRDKLADSLDNNSF